MDIEPKNAEATQRQATHSNIVSTYRVSGVGKAPAPQTGETNSIKRVTENIWLITSLLHFSNFKRLDIYIIQMYCFNLSKKSDLRSLRKEKKQLSRS